VEGAFPKPAKFELRLTEFFSKSAQVGIGDALIPQYPVSFIKATFQISPARQLGPIPAKFTNF